MGEFKFMVTRIATKVAQTLREEMSGLHLRLLAVSTVARLLPRRSANDVRTRLFRQGGFQVGEGTLLCSLPRINGSERLFANLVIGSHCVIDVECTLDLEERITIGDRVTVGPEVMILTSTHKLGSREHRAGPVIRSPVIIGNGAWLGARCTVLPGVTIGEGAVVAPGSLVNKDVAPHSRVGGIPARQLEALDPA